MYKRQLEILETVEPTPELIAACRELKAAGYRIALDDFIWEPKFQPLVELADYIKVDFLQSDAAARQDLFKRLSGRAITLVAEKIETQSDYMQACAEGFILFQGYFFCRPLLLENRKAVSYTHLDVYKRQERGLRRWCVRLYRPKLKLRNRFCFSRSGKLRQQHGAVHVQEQPGATRTGSNASSGH